MANFLMKTVVATFWETFCSFCSNIWSHLASSEGQNIWNKRPSHLDRKKSFC